MVLNEFMVSCFYSILSDEERALESLTNGKLTIKEIHFIEAVFKTQKTGANTFSNIANMLGVALGTLTKAFLKLESKGYLAKIQDKNDKRIFYIVPTRIAQVINDEHTKWHQKLIEDVVATIPEKDLENFIDGMKNLCEFFKKKGS